MSTFVIDTNVLRVSNGQSSHASLTCVAACIGTLIDIRNAHRSAVDAEGHIFAEYFKNASRSGQPGVGDSFAKWLWDNQGVSKHCELVRTHPEDAAGREFEVFRSNEALDEFDLSDRKFVMVALNSGFRPKVLNAVDSDWAIFADALVLAGVVVQELCG